MVMLAVLALAAAGLSEREWVRWDRPCWDRYCGAGRWFTEWLAGGIGTDVLLLRLRRWVHGNSFIGPLLFGSIAHVFRLDVVTAYRVLSAASTAAALLVLYRGVLRPGPADVLAAGCAWWLAAAHVSVIRSFSFPQTDATALLWVTATLALALPGRPEPSRWRHLAALAVVTTGLFLKLSLYPAVLFLPLLLLAEGARTGLRRALGLLPRALLWAALPLGLFAAVCLRLGLMDTLVAELRARNLESDSSPLIVAEALFKAVLPFAPWIWIGRRRWGARERALAAWALLFLAALLAAQAAGYLRYHLVLIPAYAGLALPGLAAVRERSGAGALVALATGAAALSLVSLLANTYN
jgi:hypothetical protein